MQQIAPCPWCRGKDDHCTRCDGANQVPIFRCPRKLVTRRELDVINAAALVTSGILPDPGGWQEQALTFVVAWPLVMHEINHWQHVAHEQAMKKAKAKAR